MIDIQNVTVSYNRTTTLDFPDWSLPQAEHCLMLGPSGSGKTTLLHVLGGLLRPASGKVTVAGENIGKLSSGKLDKFRGRNIGLVFQRPHLIQALTVQDNLLAAQYFAGLKQDKQRIAEVLAELGIPDKAGARPFELSQGQAQRVAIARALLNRPAVILADEPTSSLDDDNCEAVARLLLQQSEKYKATLLISTHDQRLKTEVPRQLVLKRQKLEVET